MFDLQNDLFNFERRELSRKALQVPLAFKRSKSFNDIYEFLSSNISSKKNIKKEIWFLITACINIVKNNTDSFKLPLDKRQYRGTGLDAGKMTRMILDLESQGLLTFYKGFYNGTFSKNHKGMKSIIEVSPKLLNLFDFELCVSQKNIDMKDEVILRDSDKNPLSLNGMRGVQKERDLIRKYNKVLESSDIKIIGQRIFPQYRSIYCNNLKTGGRLYSESQQERSELRRTITIDSEPTTEIDYSNIHFRILYNEKGVNYQEDAYEIEPPEGIDSSDYRKLVKLASLILLNTNSISAAKRALTKKIKEQSLECTQKPSELSEHILNSLMDKHSTISDSFFTGAWGRLQNIDSQMAKYIIRVFTSKGVPILSYHDSFVVQSRYKNLLIKTMKEAWKAVLGSYKSLGHDIEFNNVPEIRVLKPKQPKPKQEIEVNSKSDKINEYPSLDTRTISTDIDVSIPVSYNISFFNNSENYWYQRYRYKLE